MANKLTPNLILKMTSQDIKFGLILIDCRYAPSGMICRKRERQWIKSGFVKKVNHMIGKKSIVYLELTEKGWKFLQKNPDIMAKDRYTSKKDAKLHDIRLVQQRIKAMEAGKLWINEKSAHTLLESRKEFLVYSGRGDEANRISYLQSNNLISAPDGIIFDPNSGEYEIVEIITRNYTGDDIEAKRTWARHMNIRDDFECIKAY